MTPGEDGADLPAQGYGLLVEQGVVVLGLPRDCGVPPPYVAVEAVQPVEVDGTPLDRVAAVY